VFIVATWIAAGIFLIAWFIYPHSVSSFDPARKRSAVANLAFNSGLPAFMLFDFAVGFARLSRLCLGTFIAGLALLIPLLFVVAIYVTPLGPEKFHFSVGDRVFDIDWHMSPRSAASGLCFDASGRGPYEDPRHRPLNRQICISQTGGPLVARVPSVAGDRRWIEAGLNCEEVFVTQRAGRVCSSVDAAGHTATLIECQPGDCFLQFNDHGLRYSMHLNPEDFAAWRALQERALRLVTEVSRADSSPSEP